MPNLNTHTETCLKRRWSCCYTVKVRPVTAEKWEITSKPQPSISVHNLFSLPMNAFFSTTALTIRLCLNSNLSYTKLPSHSLLFSQSVLVVYGIQNNNSFCWPSVKNSSEGLCWECVWLDFYRCGGLSRLHAALVHPAWPYLSSLFLSIVNEAWVCLLLTY